jgi:hypothetical protein
MSTYSNVDTILTPSLIDISPVTEPSPIKQEFTSPIGSFENIPLSPIPGNFPPISNITTPPIPGNFPPISNITTPPIPVNYQSLSNITTPPIPVNYQSLSSITTAPIIPEPISRFNSTEQQMSVPKVSSPSIVFSETNISENYRTPVIPIASPPASPVELLSTIAFNKKMNQGYNQSSIGPLPNKPIPAFAPPKNIDVSVQMNQTLKSQLKSADIDIRGKAVNALEKMIVKMQGHCPDDIVDNLRIRTFQLDANTIDTYLNTAGRYDHDYQDGMGCLIDALVSQEDIIPDIRLRRWITDISRIGGASAEGMAFKLQSGPYPLYVIKVAADPNDDTLPHEAIVGMGAINKLRNRIPNFMHTYGAFMCSPPILDDNGKVVAWCPAKTNSISYLVLENIQDGEALGSVIWDLDENEYLQIYLQILNALNLAYKEFDYTHYDLHANNVLIQTLSYDISVPLYNPNGGIVYIKTRRLARIIDYGFSHIYLQGQHFGKYELEHVSVYPEESFPMHDAYKVLLSSYYYSLNQIKNNTIVQQRTLSPISQVVNNIYSFFKEGKTAEERLKERNSKQWSDYFQPSDIHKSTKLDTLLSFILSKYSPYFISSDQPTDAISTICEDNCIDWDAFIQQVFNQTRLPTTLEDYCQAYTAIEKLSSNDYKVELRKWLQQFNTDVAYNNEKDPMLNKLNDSIVSINTIQLLTIDDPNFNANIYINELRKLVKLRSEINYIKAWLTSAICSFNINQRLAYISEDIKAFIRGINDTKQRVDDFKKIINYNISTDTVGDIINIPDIKIMHNIILS